MTSFQRKKRRNKTNTSAKRQKIFIELFTVSEFQFENCQILFTIIALHWCGISFIFESNTSNINDVTNQTTFKMMDTIAVFIVYHLKPLKSTNIDSKQQESIERQTCYYNDSGTSWKCNSIQEWQYFIVSNSMYIVVVLLSVHDLCNFWKICSYCIANTQ